MADHPCHMCGRPLEECRVPVDKHWPARAREAYARADMKNACTCPQGQAFDVKATGGWCYDRARMDKYWTGKPLTPAQRRGAGLAREEAHG